MSLKIKLEIDELEKPLEGYVSNEIGWALRDILEEGIENYKNRSNK